MRGGQSEDAGAVARFPEEYIQALFTPPSGA